MIDLAEHDVAVAGIRGPLKLEDVLFQAKKANRLAPLQVVRADRVNGPDHVAHAARLTWRAIEEGRNRADKKEVELTRYLAARRTIKEALEHVGIRDGDAGAVIALGPDRAKAIEYFAEMLGLEEDDSLLAPSMEKVRAFGISDHAIEATTPDRRIDLVLEAVAAVDLMRN